MLWLMGHFVGLSFFLCVLTVTGFAGTEGFKTEEIIADPGVIQKKNSQGEWYISLDRRDVVESDVEDLSPLEVCQAVVVLTGKTWSLDTVLFHLDEFRNAIRVAYDGKKLSLRPGAYSTQAP